MSASSLKQRFLDSEESTQRFIISLMIYNIQIEPGMVQKLAAVSTELSFCVEAILCPWHLATTD